MATAAKFALWRQRPSSRAKIGARADHLRGQAAVNQGVFLIYNGASSNYDGNGRNASDNNTLYAFLWFNF
jgi:hypothetical protein